MKLNLRDYFWLILVAGLLVAWWLDRNSVRAEAVAERAQKVAELEDKIREMAMTMLMTPSSGGVSVGP